MRHRHSSDAGPNGRFRRGIPASVAPRRQALAQRASRQSRRACAIPGRRGGSLLSASRPNFARRRRAPPRSRKPDDARSTQLETIIEDRSMDYCCSVRPGVRWPRLCSRRPNGKRQPLAGVRGRSSPRPLSPPQSPRRPKPPAKSSALPGTAAASASASIRHRVKSSARWAKRPPIAPCRSAPCCAFRPCPPDVSTIVKINDRGPAASTGRALDLSRGAAVALGIAGQGEAKVAIEVVH